MGDVPPAGAAQPRATVWTRENEFSSRGGTMTVPLQGLPSGAAELCGRYVCVDEHSAAGQKLICSPFDPNDGPKSRCFTQKFAYYTLDRFIRFLSDELDCDMELVRAIYRRSSRTLPVHVNIPQFVNAYYFPPDEDLSFGDGMGRFSLATDGDVLVHEAVHWVIDVINPTLGEGFLAFGQSIHEGVADAVTALFFGDPQIGEDFNKFKNGAGYPGGLRSVHNTRTFRNTQDLDPHELGKVISGYWWSLYEGIHALLRQRNAVDALKSPALYEGLARRAAIKIALTNTGSYRAPSPGPADFIEATVTAVKELAQVGELEELTKHNVDVASVVALARQEGVAREFSWMQAQMAQDPLATAPANLAFGTPVTLTGTAGAVSTYYPQVYQTRSGPALVVGYGKIERPGAPGAAKISSSKFRKVDAESIDETVSIGGAGAYQAAFQAIERDLGTFLAARTGDAAIPLPTRVKLLRKARDAITASGVKGGRLALLPFQKNLVWLFDAGTTHVAVDAKSGKATFILKAMVD